MGERSSRGTVVQEEDYCLRLRKKGIFGNGKKKVYSVLSVDLYNGSFVSVCACICVCAVSCMCRDEGRLCQLGTENYEIAGITQGFGP